jgi:uncharacterized protein
LIVDLHEIERDGTVFDGTVGVSPLEGPVGEPITVAEATLHGEIRPGARGHDLFGRFRAIVEVECSRCLQRFPVVLAEDFFLTLVRSVEPAADTDHEVTEADASLYVVPTGRLDLAEVVAEQIYLALPLKPMCRPDCRGLCPDCRTNLNTSECGCRPPGEVGARRPLS